MNTDFLGVTPATVYREFLYHPDGPMAHWIDDRYDLVARPNHRATRTPATGDVAIEVTLGSNHPGQCTVLDAVTADRFAALRRQPAGRLVLRPRSSAVPPRDEDESDLSAHEAQTGTLVRVGSQRSWTYPFTTDDLQWTAKLLVHEAGGTDDADNAAVLWAMFNKYALFAHRRYDTFSTFIRAYSTTLQPVLRSARAAARHAYKPPSEFVRTGGTYPGTGILRGQLRRHLDIQQAPWQSIKLSARDLAVRALSGRLPNPGIGLASEFASTRIYFRQRHGRNPSRDEWRAYTMDLASRKNWRWIGEVPGLDQMRNAFFLDLRAAGLPGDAVHIRRPEGSRQGGE